MLRPPRRSRLTPRRVFLALALLAAADLPRASAAQDATTGADSLHRDERTPRGALRRALVAPGWGQFYNGQPLKAPVVWAGLGGLGAGVVGAHRTYRRWGDAYIYAVCTQTPASCGVPDPERYAEAGAPYANAQPAALRARRDQFRRNRDLLLLGVGLGYGLQALDAYISAHLLHFDDDARLTVHPVTGPDGPGLALRLGPRR